MIRCVVFDFDGTLVKSNEIKKQIFYEITKNYSGTSQVLDKLLSNPNLASRYQIFNTLISETKLNIKFGITNSYLNRLYTQISELKVSSAPEVPGAYKTLVKLKSLKIKIFLSSATPIKTLKKIIKIKCWEYFFEDIFGYPKSKEQHLEKILNLTKFKLSEIIYIGDSEADQRAASLVGCKFIGIGLNYERFNKKPKIFLHNLNNLEEVLNNV